MQPRGADKDHIMIRYVRLIFASSEGKRSAFFAWEPAKKRRHWYFLSEWAPGERLGVVKVWRRERSVPQPG